MLVVTALTDRLDITGWQGPNATDAEKIWDPRTDVASQQFFDDAVTCGDGFVIVWRSPTAQGPIMWPQRPEWCAVSYDTENPGVVRVGAKVWAVATGTRSNIRRYRANLYYPDRIVKLVTSGEHSGWPVDPKKFVPWTGDDDADTITHGYGVTPIFHIGNGARLNHYGRSELHDVIPIQDALNKTVLDMLVGSEYVALPQRYATGVDDDDEDDAIDGTEYAARRAKFVPGVDRVWTVGNEGATFGEFPGADLTGFIAMADFFKATAAQVTGTPAHYLMLQGGEFPSGESLKTAEARLVKRVGRRMNAWGTVEARAMALAVAIDKGTNDVDSIGVEPVWASPESRDETTFWSNAAVKHGLGVPKDQILKEAGYTEDQIKEFAEMRDASGADAFDQAMTAFLGGNVGAPAPA